jgi:hypothetical protein
MRRFAINIGHLLFWGIAVAAFGCQKTGTVPSMTGVASLTVVDAVPNSYYPIPVINTGEPIQYFYNAQYISYGGFAEFSPPAGIDTVYVVSQNSDTADLNPKSASFLFYGVLKFRMGGVYTLFVTGSDTSSPDYLLTNDTIPQHSFDDSVVGIRFVNLVAGSNPIKVNLEGSSNGSEVSALPYKGISGFRNYVCNSTVAQYAITGDSITNCLLNYSTANGLLDPNTYQLLTFRNITIAYYGSQIDSNGENPIMTMVVDDY